MQRDDKAIVTIGVPVYNNGTMLRDMLQSLERQTFSRFQVNISDNASTDDTAEVARSFTERDPRFAYARNETNIGAAPNYNRAFALGHATPYFKWAQSDDLYAPTFLERCVEMLERHPDATIAYPITGVVDEVGDGRVLDWASYRLGVLDSFVDDRGRQGWTMGPLHLAEGADPARRLDEFLNRAIGCFELLGVIRTAALERSTLHVSYYGQDRALLAQLLLMGPFRQVPERLYTSRFHKTVSRNLTERERRTWIDTKGGLSFPMLRQKWDILRAPSIAGLPPRDRVRCIAIALRHFGKRQAGSIARTIFPGLATRGANPGASA